MFQVTEIISPQSLTGLRCIWDELLRQTPGATFFQSLDWLQTFWKFHRGDDTRSLLRVLLVQADGQPVGILPLVVTTEKYRLGPIRVLGYPLAGWGSFYGPIGPRPAETLAAGLKHIRGTPRDWDVLDLRWVDSEIDRAATPYAFGQAGFPCEPRVWHTSAQIELADGWDRYWAARKSTWRSNVRRCERLLSKHGKLEYVRYRPLGAAKGESDPRWDLYHVCVSLASRSWQGSSTSGTTLSHDSVRDYLRAAHQSAVNAGGIDLNLLLLNNRPVAFAYNYHYRGAVYGVRSGFDPSAVQQGAGTVLMAKMIEDSCLRGDRLIDLGPNYLECKRYWLTHLQPAFHFTHFNPASVRAQGLRLQRIAKRWLGITRPTAEIPSAVRTGNKTAA